MTTMERLAVAALLFGMSCCAPAFQEDPPIPPAGNAYDVTIFPGQLHQQWLAEVVDCATAIHAISPTYAIRDTVPSVWHIAWRAVPTEHPLGGFACTNRVGMCWGETFEGDSILIRISARALAVKSLIKHELLHVVVDSPNELHVPDHGLPWGFCEWR